MLSLTASYCQQQQNCAVISSIILSCHVLLNTLHHQPHLIGSNNIVCSVTNNIMLSHTSYTSHQQHHVVTHISPTTSCCHTHHTHLTNNIMLSHTSYTSHQQHHVVTHIIHISPTTSHSIVLSQYAVNILLLPIYNHTPDFNY